MDTTFNVLDLIFMVFTLIFVATALFRGFIKEIFALTAWLLALVGSYMLAPLLGDFFGKHTSSQMIADISARSVIFIFIFFAFTFATSNFSNELKERMPRAFDRSLGVFYGLVKTLLIFGVMYALLMHSFGYLAGKPVDESSPQFPEFLREAKCHDILKGSADVVNPAVKLFFDAVSQNFDKIIPQQQDNLGDKIEDVMGETKDLATDAGAAVQDEGYEKRDIEKMNRLIDIVGKK